MDLKADLTQLFHLGGQLPIYDNEPVPVISDPAQLADPAILKQFQDLVRKIIGLDFGEVAFLGRRVLEDELLAKFPQFKTQSPDLYNQYLRLVALLKFVNLKAYPLPDIQFLISNYMLDALVEGVNVRQKMQGVLIDSDDGTLLGTVAEALGKAFADSKSILGPAPLILAGQPRGLPPSIGNWLKDYLAFRRYPTYLEAQSAASFNRIAYFNQNVNVRKLSERQKKLLAQVFKLYDWLRFGEIDIELPQAVSANSYSLLDGKDLRVVELLSPSPPSLANPSPAPTPRTVLVPPDISKSPATSAVPKALRRVPPPSASARPPAQQMRPSPPVAPRKPVNLQDVLNPKNNSGLAKPPQTSVFGSPGPGINVEALAREAQAKRQEEEQKIIKKLEELKKRRPGSLK